MDFLSIYSYQDEDNVSSSKNFFDEDTSNEEEVESDEVIYLNYFLKLKYI